eukprot:g81248.t1
MADAVVAKAFTRIDAQIQDIMLDRAYANDKLSPHFAFIDYSTGLALLLISFTLLRKVFRLYYVSHDDGCNEGGTLSMLLACNSVVKQSHDAIELSRSAAIVYAVNFTFAACSASDAIQAARALIASSEWNHNFYLDFILWPSRSDPPSEIVEFAAEHNKSIEVGFCKLLGGIIGNYNHDRWRFSMADAVVAKAFTRIHAVFDALSSPDISHQISYHILCSTLPSYLMHTLRDTPPAILLPILDRFHLRFLRSVLHCFGVSPAVFDSLPSYLRRAVTSQLILPCRLGGFKLLDLPMLAPIAYAASISQSLPRILPILRMAAPDYIVSFTRPDLDIELDDPVVHLHRKAWPRNYQGYFWAMLFCAMFLVIAPTIDSLHVLQRAFPISSHSNSSSLPISMDNVLPKCSPLSDVSDPISFSQYLYHFSDITSPYLSEYIRLRGRSKHDAHLQKCFTSLLNRVRHFEWLSSIDSSAPLRYRVRVRCQGNEASIPLTCPPIDRLYHLSNPQRDLMAQRRKMMSELLFTYISLFFLTGPGGLITAEETGCLKASMGLAARMQSLSKSSQPFDESLLVEATRLASDLAQVIAKLQKEKEEGSSEDDKPEEDIVVEGSSEDDKPEEDMVVEVPVEAYRYLLQQFNNNNNNNNNKPADTQPAARTPSPSPPPPPPPPPRKTCSDFLTCPECLSQLECGWCIGSRACVLDNAQVCNGMEDQVSRRQGFVQRCPSLEDRRHRDSHEQWEDEEEERMRQIEEGEISEEELDQNITCVSWRQTAGCDPAGPREPEMDRPCEETIPSGKSGYCECSNSNRAHPVECQHDPFNCTAECAKLPLLRQEAAQRVKAALEEARIRELAAVREEITTDNTKQGSTASAGETEEEKRNRHREVKKRAKLAKKGEGGAKDPYGALDIDREATQTDIRRAYRKLSLLLHPDKNRDIQDEAQIAFADLVVAHEILGDPAKRAAFDDYGGRKGFQTEWEYRQYGQNDAHHGFYGREKYITELTSKIFNKRLTGDSIWLVMFYAPWCSHCANFVGRYRAIAEALKDEAIEVGAVNCESNKYLCNEKFNIRQYPTMRMLSRKRGMQQEFMDQHSEAHILQWVRKVAAEWTWLFHNSDLKELGVHPDNPKKDFRTQLMASKDFWAVLVLDDKECSQCKTAITNMMRLSAGVRGLAEVGLLVCDASTGNRQLCDQMGLPNPPFNPQVRGWGSGNKSSTDPGEMLYNPNDLDPHVALQLLEKVIKLTEADKVADGAVTSGKESDWEKDKPSPSPTPEPMWNAPKPRAQHHFIRVGGGHQGAPQIGRG